MQTQTLANGAQTTYSYTALGQMSDLVNKNSGGTTLSQFGSMTHDGAGNRASITATLPSATSLSGTTGYQYDTKNQLTQEQTTRNSGYTDGFAYDAAGNPTTFKGTTKTFNANNQQTATGFAHDNNGNPTTYGGVSLSFDPENRLTSYGSVLTAGYTGDGLRAWKQNTSGRMYFLYDGSLPVVELDATGAVTATNTFGAHGLVARRTTTSTFYTFDAQGSVAQRLDASQNVLASHLFTAHGSEVTTASAEPFGYGAQWGYYTDRETGLLLTTFRYYDPNAGRFLTRDPISYAGGINLYAYVKNSPIDAADPSGLRIWGVTAGGSLMGGVEEASAGVAGSGSLLYGATGCGCDGKDSVLSGGLTPALSGGGLFLPKWPSKPNAPRQGVFGAFGGIGGGIIFSEANLMSGHIL